MGAVKKYAVVGVSNRAIGMYMDPIERVYTKHAELVGMLDTDFLRMKNYNAGLAKAVPMFSENEFDRMMSVCKPDAVIIACPDHLHHCYIEMALAHDVEVICEKPLTTDIDKARAIASAAKKSGGKITVTFNVRYSPASMRLRELIQDGKIGEVVSMDLNWYIDTYHGSSYFQRWNRLRECSGGLYVHKSCHHFDLIHWLIDQDPMEIFAYGSLNFYGPHSPYNPLGPGETGDGRTCPDCDARSKCQYYMRWYRNEFRGCPDEDVRNLRQYSDYSARQCIFDPQINIEDTYSALVKYRNGAVLTYSCNASLPFEGYRLNINGTQGRIEYEQYHAPDRLPFPAPAGQPSITYIPLFGGRERIDVVSSGGGHRGGDPLLQDELFMAQRASTTVSCQADYRDGIEAVLAGVAIGESIRSGKTIKLDTMRKMVYADAAKIESAATLNGIAVRS